VEELPHIGSEVKLYTYLYVREDIMQLYGFLRTEDLEVFKLLLTVSGIGPKAALGILSAITPDDLRFAVLSEDKKTISKAPGIGMKTAGKLILELKDKFKLEDAFTYKFSHEQEKNAQAENGEGAEKQAEQSEKAAMKAMRKDAVEALTALGYSQTEAMKAVNSVDMEKMSSVEDVLKASLKACSGSF
jgi:Holliday junction DNA helicase RuvA